MLPLFMLNSASLVCNDQDLDIYVQINWYLVH
ncbi:protein of unknown function [Paraburkholderia dioscoreae]|uniref:Uncharacterized protein n=1 Tax=Paraburkholderia dioscoreae TaxID=2604047 RepID=A0A5Q4ZJS9_9BURK|nr:protein of unknown function [Paraburkholderia dioscoreae]